MQQLQSGTLLQGGKYRIERVLGQGGFGITYLVRNEMLNGYMAVKEFFLKDDNDREVNGTRVTVPHETKRALFEEQRAKFKKEAQRMFSLKNEHIVQIYDLFEENSTVYYAMDYVQGDSLKKRMDLSGTLFSEQEVWKILPQILDALDVMHRHQIYHLDLKPDNILLSSDGVVKVIDFGASKQFGTSTTLTTVFPYTPGYAPKEQKDQRVDQVGPWTDFYALGATLYKMLTGENPSNIDVVENGEDAFHFGSNVSRKMQELIIWLMQPQIKKRPQSVDDIRDSINVKPNKRRDSEGDVTVVEVTHGSGTSSAKSTKPQVSPVMPSEPETNWKTISIIVLVALIIGIGGYALWNNSNRQNTKIPSEDLEQIDPIIQNLMDNMVHVEGGTFTMGATSEQGDDADADEKPAHRVTLSSFSIGKYEVTQEEWQAVMGNNPSNFKGAKRPVEQVSWDDCQEFIRKLNAMTGKQFRLPTEAEWEYAARGGSQSRGYKYAGSNNLDNVAWYYSNASSQTHDVGGKQPNELGLYDMSGNVWEWCQDWYGDYSSSTQANPRGASSGSNRVYRGGVWNYDARYCRVSLRYYFTPDYRGYYHGLRLAQ